MNRRGLDNRGIIFWLPTGSKDSFRLSTLHIDPGVTPSAVQPVPDVLFPWVKQEGREADHALLYSAQVKNK